MKDTIKVCFNKGHNGGTHPVTSSSDLFQLPRPVPLLPLMLPPSVLVASNFPVVDSSQAMFFSDSYQNLSSGTTTEPADSGLHPFHFAKPVPAALAADWSL